MATFETAKRHHPRYGHEQVAVWAPENQPRGCVVLVHGIAEHAGRYQRTAGLLADAGLRTVAPDLFGFGASGGARAYVERWDDYWDQVATHIEEARNSAVPVILLGHSMGGLIAASYGLSDRPQPDYLVLSAPALSGGTWWQRAAAPVLAAVAPRLEIPNALEGGQLSRDPAVAEAYFADPLVYTKTTARLGSELFRAQSLTKSRVDGWHRPTLVLHGGADTIVAPASTAPLADLPPVERRLYPKLRHEIFNEPEGPEVVAEAIEWIDARLASRDRSVP